MKGIKPVITEKNEFEYRDKSKVLAFFANFGISELCGPEKMSVCTTDPLLHKS